MQHVFRIKKIIWTKVTYKYLAFLFLKFTKTKFLKYKYLLLLKLDKWDMQKWDDLTSRQWSVLPASSSWSARHSTALYCCKGSSHPVLPSQARFASPWTRFRNSTKSCSVWRHAETHFADETCRICRDPECARSVRRSSVQSANLGTDIHPGTRLK